ncbi:hypothetical protein [Rhizobium ruizarguesonis]|uniref:Uncharacterized protein n=1 Tax=Rhizobium ruizarguesonis TaxID=2081791 RepID=A0AAE8QBP8_9HYPH|nr:hypothetical protein [Rhizobium ruizarguesonis]TBE49309.1 hypothetical protein ELH06_09120 [Rhizobium ruizarguesonis]TBF18453.1 hypothetical protein ELG94_08805 [Rhizobium ruizarguesonis]
MADVLEVQPRSDEEFNDWLNHPDVDNAQPLINEIFGESDRGATLIAVEILNGQLEKIIISKVPEFVASGKKLKDLMNFNGPFGTFSSKIKVAAVNRWLHERTYRSIEALRALRNEAAHSNIKFSLKNHDQQLDRFLDLGDGAPVHIHNIAMQTLMEAYVEGLTREGERLSESIGTNPFDTPEKLQTALKNNPGWPEKLEEQLPRMKLAIGVYLFLGLLLAASDR